MSDNREVVLVLAGVFFFLPLLVFSLTVPPPMGPQAMAATADATDSTAVSAAMEAWLLRYWWALALLSVIQTVGGLAVMAVIGDPARPTVAEAMRRGGVYLITQIAAQIIFTLAAVAVIVVVMSVGALTGSKAIAGLLVLALIPFAFFAVARLSLTGPAIAIECIANPLAALRRSWQLVKGNTLRLLAFMILLFIPYVVISWVLGMIVRLIGALPGAETARIIEAVLSGLLNATILVIGYAVFASAHRQLVRGHAALSHHEL